MQLLVGIFTLILFRVRIRRKSFLQSKRRLKSRRVHIEKNFILCNRLYYFYFDDVL